VEAISYWPIDPDDDITGRLDAVGLDENENIVVTVEAERRSIKDELHDQARDDAHQATANDDAPSGAEKTTDDGREVADDRAEDADAGDDSREDVDAGADDGDDVSATDDNADEKL
jgi:hypothetical protein